MKYFVVSDIHGHASIFKKELDKCGFVDMNPDNMLVCLGDCFDRGYENIEVMNILNGIKNKILIKGNHEDMLEEAIKEREISYVDIHNGTDITLEEFFGIGSINPLGHLMGDYDGKIRDTIFSFTNQMLDYYETEKYIFVHGWIPYSNELGMVKYNSEWRNSSFEEWRKARFALWWNMYPLGINKTGKTIVCGHSSCSYAFRIDPKRKDNDYRPYFGKDVIAIDANTYSTGKLNIITLVD